MKIRPVGADLMYADRHRQTDRQMAGYEKANQRLSRVGKRA
jgi:hypothetical protein